MRILALLLAVALAGCDALGPEDETWSQLRSLAAIGGLVPPPDASNRWVGDPRAEALGQKFYFDSGFSGTATLVDTLGRAIPVPPGRAEKGTEVKIACATCHDPARGGTDHSSNARVSIGAGAYDVSSQPSVNAAFNELWYWNGRNDSLWAQIVAVTESGVSMGGNRLRTMWRIADAYRDEFEALFGPLPVTGTVAGAKAGLAANGQCVLDLGGGCPSDRCTEDMNGCWPRFPLQGRPGAQMGCQRGVATEPFGDAYDCMAEADRDKVDGVYVGFAKLIAAYEYRLISDDSPFDRWVEARVDGKDGDEILSAAAQRGARLFVGKASCNECHSTPLFTDREFHDIAVPQDGAFVPTEDQCRAGLAACDCVMGRSCLPWGLFDGLGKLQRNRFRRDSKWSDDPTDASRARWYGIDLAAEDNAKLKRRWKTPGLRDVAITAPYMHNGRYATLREVLDHYNWGGHPTGAGRDAKVTPLGLDDYEIDDLIAFLESLTGAPMPMELVTAPELPPATTF